MQQVVNPCVWNVALQCKLACFVDLLVSSLILDGICQAQEFGEAQLLVAPGVREDSVAWYAFWHCKVFERKRYCVDEPHLGMVS